MTESRGQGPRPALPLDLEGNVKARQIFDEIVGRFGKLRVYFELTKPRIALLILLVALSAYLASAPGVPNPVVLAALLGAGALSSFGSSALNHYVDREVDAEMLRTKHRPLPTGRLPPRAALLFGLGLVGGGVGLSLLFINPLAAFFIFLGAFFYVVVYTLVLKPRTVWNIVIGGFAGSCPALAGSAAAVNGITLPAFLIALLVFLWTPGHFWALSLRNRRDYARAGIPMLPAVVGERWATAAIILSTLLVALFVPAFALLGTVALPYLAPALVAAAALTYTTVRIRDVPGAAWSSFRFSGVFLTITLLTVGIAPLLP